MYVNDAIFPWQVSVWNFLLERYQKKRLPSVFLFEGMKGIGKMHFAQAFAAFLLCQSKHTNTQCGACGACHFIKSGTHPDFIQVVGEGSGQMITIDQIRVLNEEVFKTTYLEGVRVVIIESAHRLNLSAANALLKTLEESPLFVIFILLTDQSYQILPTIRSRCERIKFSKPPFELAHTWLKDQCASKPIENYSPEFLLRLTQGCPLEAKTLIENATLHWRESLIRDFSAVILGNIDPLSLAEKYKELDQRVLFFWIKTIIMDFIYLKNGVKEKMLHLDQLTILESCASRLDTAHLFDYLDQIYSLEAKIRQFNLNPLLVIDEIFCNCM
jgi:DNA polymerase III subunit delta'